MDIDSGPYRLSPVNTTEWTIIDRRYHASDTRRLVARIWEVDTNECEVTWMRELPLSAVYASAVEAFEDLCRTSRHTKPVHIPHFPPTDPSRSGEGPRIA